MEKKEFEKRVSNYCDKMSKKYDWFCCNGWVLEDIYINFAAEFDNHHFEVIKELDKMPKYMLPQLKLELERHIYQRTINGDWYIKGFQEKCLNLNIYLTLLLYPKL